MFSSWFSSMKHLRQKKSQLRLTIEFSRGLKSKEGFLLIDSKEGSEKTENNNLFVE